MERPYHPLKNPLSAIFLMLTFQIGPLQAMEYEAIEMLRMDRKLFTEDPWPSTDILFSCCFPCFDWRNEESINLSEPEIIKVWNEEETSSIVDVIKLYPSYCYSGY